MKKTIDQCNELDLGRPDGGHTKRHGKQKALKDKLRQRGGVVKAGAAVKLRTRVGSWGSFERRFEPMPAPDHDYLWDVGTVPENADYRYWWTVLDCDGRLYLAPGFHFVNRSAFVRCAKQWSDSDTHQPGYRYD